MQAKTKYILFDETCELITWHSQSYTLYFFSSKWAFVFQRGNIKYYVNIIDQYNLKKKKNLWITYKPIKNFTFWIHPKQSNTKPSTNELRDTSLAYKYGKLRVDSTFYERSAYVRAPLFPLAHPRRAARFEKKKKRTQRKKARRVNGRTCASRWGKNRRGGVADTSLVRWITCRPLWK